METLYDYEDEERKQTVPLKKPFNSVLDSSDPLQFLKTAFEFVANETDLFKKESVIKDVNDLVRSVKEKIDFDEKKRKEKDANVSSVNGGAGVKRVMEDSSPAGPSQSAFKKTDDQKITESKDVLREPDKKNHLKVGLKGQPRFWSHGSTFAMKKLTPHNFEKLVKQVKLNIDNADTLSGVIGQIFNKALMEPTFVEIYARFCSRLSVELPDFSEDNEKITFKRLLLNKCQEEFERGVREQEEANRTEEEGGVKQTEEQREEKRVKARRRMLGNIRFIGELYKKKMLTERIMHECIKKLLGQYQNPDEEDMESLCKLLSTIGEMIDHPKAKEHMDAYFDMMYKLSNNLQLSSRVRFMLKDAIDLRKNKWQQRRKVEGPKKIDEVHRDTAQERQAQSSWLDRGSNSNPTIRRGGKIDFRPKPSNVYLQRYIPERFSPRSMYDPSTIQEHNMNYVNRDIRNTGRGFDRVPLSSPPERAHVSTPSQSGPVLSKDHLRDKSILAIKEFYSARDKNELAFCVKELNAPNFYPTMISIWVTDSFERKDMDRDLLAKLLINLAKSHDGIISQDSFVKGFESVLSTLEDAVYDAPKAAEFLGQMFARILLENVIAYEQVWRLIYEGGEDQGQLVEIGLAAEVLGVILEIIKSEKGDPFLNNLLEGSNPRLENFRSPTMKKTSRLDKFI